MGTDSHKVDEILDYLRETAEGGDDVSVGDVVAASGDRGYGPLLFVPALIDISPIGGIPKLPKLLAAIMALVAGQIVLGCEAMWLPSLLRRRSVSVDTMSRTTDKLRPVARWLGRWLHCLLS